MRNMLISSLLVQVSDAVLSEVVTKIVDTPAEILDSTAMLSKTIDPVLLITVETLGLIRIIIAVSTCWPPPQPNQDNRD